MRVVRKIWRLLVSPEPFPRLDGPIISLMMKLHGLSWEEALMARGKENRERRAAWKRGEKIL